MSLKTNVTQIIFGLAKEDSPEKIELDTEYLLGPPYVDVEFIDEDEGFIGFYPGQLDGYGVNVDRSTSASIERNLHLIVEHHKHNPSCEYALNGATIHIESHHDQEEVYPLPSWVSFSVEVTGRFKWKAYMSQDRALLIAEGIKYAMEQYDASTIGKDSLTIANRANKLLLEKAPIPHMVPDSSAKSSDADWGTS